MGKGGIEGGNNLNVGEEVIAVLGEWGCFVQAWGSHLELGHHLGEGVSDLGEWVFHWMEVSCHLGDGGGCCQLDQDHISSFFAFSFFFSYCFSSVFLSGCQKHPFLSSKNKFGLFFNNFRFSSHKPCSFS